MLEAEKWKLHFKPGFMQNFMKFRFKIFKSSEKSTEILINWITERILTQTLLCLVKIINFSR